MPAECRQCGHDVTSHAMANQGRTNLPCEYPSCDCPDFTESSPTEWGEAPELWHYCLDGKVREYSSLLCSSGPMGHGKDFSPVQELARLQAERDEAVEWKKKAIWAIKILEQWRDGHYELRYMQQEADAFLARIRAGSDSKVSPIAEKMGLTIEDFREAWKDAPVVYNRRSSDAELATLRSQLATIPANPTAPITAEWLREVWGFEQKGNYMKRGRIKWFDGELALDSLLVPITTRHQFTQLMLALGLQPKGDV